MMNAPLNIAMPAEASQAPKAYKLLVDGKHIDARDGRSIERASPGQSWMRASAASTSARGGVVCGNTSPTRAPPGANLRDLHVNRKPCYGLVT